MEKAVNMVNFDSCFRNYCDKKNERTKLLVVSRTDETEFIGPSRKSGSY